MTRLAAVEREVVEMRRLSHLSAASRKADADLRSAIDTTSRAWMSMDCTAYDLSGTGAAAVAAHEAAADPHTQYLELDGSDAMTGDLNMGSNDVVSVGTVDGRDVSADGTKLDGIESGATADQSNAEIETAYNAQVAQVSAGEKTAGTETAIRRFAPKDIADMAGTFGGISAVADDTAPVLGGNLDLNDKRLDAGTGSNAVVRLGDAGAGTKFSIEDSGGTEVARVDSDGIAQFDGQLQADTFASAQTNTYTLTNDTTDRALDADTTTPEEIADVLSTLIRDLAAGRLPTVA